LESGLVKAMKMKMQGIQFGLLLKLIMTDRRIARRDARPENRRYSIGSILLIPTLAK
jgi:hypothetical protein